MFSEGSLKSFCEASKTAVDAAESQVKGLGQQALLDDRLNRLARKYPSQFGCNLPSCVADTGGTCGIFGCSSSRGDTECVSGKCQCKTGECANAQGTCVSAADFVDGPRLIREI